MKKNGLLIIFSLSILTACAPPQNSSAAWSLTLSAPCLGSVEPQTVFPSNCRPPSSTQLLCQKAVARSGPGMMSSQSLSQVVLRIL